jgi:hypothetical protein
MNKYIIVNFETPDVTVCSVSSILNEFSTAVDLSVTSFQWNLNIRQTSSESQKRKH